MPKGKKPKKAGIVIPFRSAKKNERFYTLLVSLIGGPITQAFANANPFVSRTIEIRGGQTLADLHAAIFDAFDRFDHHMYEFQIGGDHPMDPKARRYGLTGDESFGVPMAGKAEETTLDSLGLKVEDMFGYWFDFGDDWWHQVTVIGVADDIPPGNYPRVIAREGDSPPQYADFENEDVFDDGTDDKKTLLDELLASPDGLIGSMLEYFNVDRREGVEKKPLKPDTTLELALKKQPAIWVEAICDQYGIEPPKLADEKRQALLSVMPDEKALAKAWARLPEPSRRMLHYLVVEKEGWELEDSLSECFGEDEDLSWFWDEGHTPVTPLGLLRLNGLAYVGTRTRKGEKERIVSVPIELRETLAKLAQAESAFENAPPEPVDEYDFEEADFALGREDAEEQYARIAAIFGETDAAVSEATLAKYRKYLEEHLTKPCFLTGSADFPWEERYVLGFGEESEYEELKKTRPSYTDEYEFLDFDDYWDEPDGLFVKVRRISDSKTFVLPLAELETVDIESDNYQLLDDFSVWFVNS